MQVSAAQELLPSEADVDFYDRHGWWISPQIFSAEEIDEALDAADRYHAGDRVPVKQRLRMRDHIVREDHSIGAVGLAHPVSLRLEARHGEHPSMPCEAEPAIAGRASATLRA